MPQSFTGRTQPSNSNTAGRGQTRASGVVPRALCLFLFLVLASAATVAAQQGQTVASSTPVECGGKPHAVRLVLTRAPLDDGDARALGIVLTRVEDGAKKGFFLYWLAGKTDAPTNRDNTDGTLNGSLMSYGDGTVKDNKGVVTGAVKSFFAAAKCGEQDPQVSKIIGKLDKSPSAPADLSEVHGLLGSQSDGKDVGQIENAAVSNQTEGPKDKNEFAAATRDYVKQLPTPPTTTTTTTVTTPPGPWESERKGHLDKIAELGGRVKELELKSNSFFGDTPTWLLFVSSLTTLVTLITFGFIGWGFYKERKAQSGSDPDKPKKKDAEADAQRDQLAQITGKLVLLISAAHDRRRNVERISAPPSKAKGQDNLVGVTLNELRPCLRQGYDHTVKVAIERVVKQARESGHQQPQRVAEWKEAYGKLIDDLQALKNDLSGSGGGEGETVTNTENEPSFKETGGMSDEDIQALVTTLNQLASDVAEVKSSVDGNGTKLDALEQLSLDVGTVKSGMDGLKNTLAVNSGLRTIGQQWFGQNYSGGQTNELVSKMVEVIKLHREEYQGMEQALREHLGGSARPSDNLKKLIKERTELREKLGPYHPNMEPVQIVDAVVGTYKTAVSEVKKVLPESGGDLTSMVSYLARQYENQKRVADRVGELEKVSEELGRQLTTAQEQSAAGMALAEEVGLRLNFREDGAAENPAAVSDALNLLKREAQASVYLQLRLGLSSALMALEKVVAEGGDDERAGVIGALYLGKVRGGIKELLAGMSRYSGEELWNRGIVEGFSQRWLHYLLRADLLLNTYYYDRREFGPLRKAVSLACSSLLAALYEFQVEVAEVGLFGELPGGMETEPVYPDLRNLPAVRHKVRSKLQTIQTGEVIVDITSFPYFVRGNQQNRGRASLVNPSAWVQH